MSKGFLSLSSSFFLFLFLPLNLFSQSCAGPDPFHNPHRQRDFEAVQIFINSKRLEVLHAKEKELKITGDVRTEFFYRTESTKGKNLRGHGAVDASGVPITRFFTEIEMNLRFYYKHGDRSWAEIYLNLDDSAGIMESRRTCDTDPEGLFGSGICDDICLKRAFFGYRVYECKDVNFFDIEIGRRPLNSIFESYIMYKNRFDGILFKYSHNVEPSSNYYINLGPFIVDERVKYFAYVGEAGVLNFLNEMIDLTYSYIDWKTIGHNRCGTKDPLGSRFRVSEYSIAYNFKETAFEKLVGKKIKAQLYGAWLFNHAAKRLRETHRKENQGWYAGFIIGEVRKKGDWALDIIYEVCQAQVCPDSDVSSGIDRGNVLKETFTAERRGKTNYKGWEFEFLYAITDKLSLDAIVNFAQAENPRIGGHHHNSKCELDFIMAF